MDPAAQKRTFHTLDALRGIAALIVVIRHAPGFFAPLDAPGAGLAVDLFFVISGIVLARAYDGRLGRNLNGFAFMKLRLIRLYPLFVLGLALGALNAVASMLGHGVIGWHRDILTLAVLLALAMLPGPAPIGDGRLFALNIPTWSLFFELLVNACYAWLKPILSVRRLQLICASCVPALGAAVWLRGDIDRGVMAADAWIGLVRAIFGFSMGLWIARATATQTYRRNLPAVLALLAVTGSMLLLPVAAPLRGLWDLGCIMLAIPFIAVLAIRFEPPEWLVPACTAAGTTSYAVYVIHAPIIALTESLAGHFSWTWIGSYAPADGLILLAILCVTGWLLDRIYDAPIRRHLLVWTKQARGTAGTGAASSMQPST